jgi:hypothetical protein
MRLEHVGIHKNLGFLIQHCGGYDREYHKMSIANELEIDKIIIDNLFKESSNSNILQYVELLRGGMNINDIFNLVHRDNRISMARTRSLLSILTRYNRVSW